MYQDKFVQYIVDKLIEVEGLKAIVLGGSWASETQHPDSDIDLGLYYSEDALLDINHIRKISLEHLHMASIAISIVPKLRYVKSCMIQKGLYNN